MTTDNLVMVFGGNAELVGEMPQDAFLDEFGDFHFAGYLFPYGAPLDQYAALKTQVVHGKAMQRQPS